MEQTVTAVEKIVFLFPCFFSVSQTIINWFGGDFSLEIIVIKNTVFQNQRFSNCANFFLQILVEDTNQSDYYGLGKNERKIQREIQKCKLTHQQSTRSKWSLVLFVQVYVV